MGDVGEYWREAKRDRQQRNGRRLTKAIDQQDEIMAWCDNAGCKLAILNYSNHWQFIFATVKVNWWPSTGTYQVSGKDNPAFYIGGWKSLRDTVLSKLIAGAS